MSDALERTGIDDLRLAYAQLARARAAHAAFLIEHAKREGAFERRTGLVAGALDAARGFLLAAEEAGSADDGAVARRGEALAAPGEHFEAELESARAAHAGWAREEADRHARALQLATDEVIEGVTRLAAHTRPCLRVQVASIAAGKQAVVHLPRPRGDEAILLCALLAGHPPQSYGFLEDEEVDRVDEAPSLAIAMPGIDPAAVQAGGGEAEDALSHGRVAASDAGPLLLPIRLHLPLTDPILGWPRLRLLTRGPVLELQSREEGGAYSHLVPAAHAERFTGYLVALQTRGKVEVEVELGR